MNVSVFSRYGLPWLERWDPSGEVLRALNANYASRGVNRLGEGPVPGVETLRPADPPAGAYHRHADDPDGDRAHLSASPVHAGVIKLDRSAGHLCVPACCRWITAENLECDTDRAEVRRALLKVHAVLPGVKVEKIKGGVCIYPGQPSSPRTTKPNPRIRNTAPPRIQGH